MAHYNLAFACERQRRPAAAIAAYERAIALAPGLAEAHGRLGNLLHAQGRRDEALACFRRVTEIAPDSPDGRVARAKILLEEGRTFEAEAVLRRLVAAPRPSGEAWRLLGSCLSNPAGSPRRGGAWRARSPAIRPRFPPISTSTRSRRLTAADGPLIGRIEARLNGPDLTDVERAVLHFALGKGHDDLGDYAAAIGHFDTANRLERAGPPFDRAAFAATVDRIIAGFGADRLAAAAAADPDPDLPVLILGLPRSGTTLVEQIVSGHPQVGAGGELPFWNDRAAAIDPADPQGVHAAARDYLDLLRGIAPQARRVTDKMPFNFLWAGLIHLALPGARLIHCRRHPVDTCLSIYQTRFAIRHESPTTAATWSSIPAVRAADGPLAQGVAGRPVPRGRVRSPGARARTHGAPLVDFIGLPWDPACLRPEANRRPIRTASRGRRVADPPRVGRPLAELRPVAGGPAGVAARLTRQARACELGARP